MQFEIVMFYNYLRCIDLKMKVKFIDLELYEVIFLPIINIDKVAKKKWINKSVKYTNIMFHHKSQLILYKTWLIFRFYISNFNRVELVLKQLYNALCLRLFEIGNVLLVLWHVFLFCKKP